jgi:hypothetical protein
MVRLALIKVRSDGTPLRAIARRTLRRGTVRFTLSEPGTYQVRVVIGQRHYWSWLEVSACGIVVGDRAELRLDAATARPGGILGYRIVNTSAAGYITAGRGYVVERLLPDGSWARAAGPGGITLEGYLFPPGQEFAKQAALPAELPVGHYRLLDTVSAQTTPEGPTELRLTAEFDVVN